MAKRDILKEAIADAKAVKEVAIANAKLALEEAFTPQLKSMLAKRIEEMDKEEDDEVKEEQTNEMLDTKTNIERHGDEGDTDPEEIETEKMAKKLEEEDEIDLDEILAELEEEMDTDKEDIKEDARTDAEEEGYEDGMEDEKEDIEDEEADSEEEEVDLEDMTDEDLKVFIEDVIADMVAGGELEAGDNFEEEETEDIEVEDDVDVEVEDSEEIEIAETNKNSVYTEAIAKLKKELKEANATIKTLKESNNVKNKALNEVNLLNSKLLYTNKIFKSKNLTESQKVKVLGAFDKATTVKESKLVFETLKEGLKSKRTPIRESLGSASRPSGTVRTKKPIIEADPMVSRFQKLAGIK